MPSVARESYLLQNLKVDIEISPELQNLIEKSGEIGPVAIKLGLRKVTREMSKQTKEKIKSLGLVNSGQLAKSIRGSTTNKKSYVGTKLWYAHFLEDGTKPHTIKPRKSSKFGYLRIPFENRTIYTRRANHPGNKAYKFSEGTFNKMQASGEINSLFAQGVQQAIEELSK